MPSHRGSPSQRPRACPGPPRRTEVDRGAVGLRGVVVIVPVSSGSVGDDELGVPVPDVDGQGLLQPPLTGSVDQGDSGGAEPTEPALECAGASQVMGEGQVDHLQIVVAGERDLLARQIGDADLQGDVLVVPERSAPSAREVFRRCREEVATLLHEGGDGIALCLAEGHPLGLVGGTEAMGPSMDGCEVPGWVARDAVLLVTQPLEVAGDLHPAPIGRPVAVSCRLALVVQRSGHGSKSYAGG